MSRRVAVATIGEPADGQMKPLKIDDLRFHSRVKRPGAMARHQKGRTPRP